MFNYKYCTELFKNYPVHSVSDILKKKYGNKRRIV